MVIRRKKLPIDNVAYQKVINQDIRKTGWAETLTDESNLWLLASRYEEANDYEMAAVCYYNDASKHFKNHPARGGLGFANAAMCLLKLGKIELARELFTLSAQCYMRFAENSLRSSPYDAVKGYARAYISYRYAGLAKEAEHAKKLSQLIEKRLNPRVTEFEVNKQYMWRHASSENSI